MKFSFNYCLILLVLFVITSCKKSNAPNPSPINPPKKDTDVYVVGDIVAKNGKQIAVYWKNGTIVRLTDSTQTSFGQAIAVSGNDVYVAGVIDDDNYNSTAVYWKNGVVTQLSNAPFDGSTTKSIAISGTDVYVTGLITGTTGGLYWKNGIPVAASGNLSNVKASGIAINGTDVYVSGTSVLSDLRTTVATYWKNGVATQLSNSLSNGFGIAVNGADIYVAGGPNTLSSTAGYWKNGNFITLNSQPSGAYAVGINGNDVFVGGINTVNNGNTTVACYWKNGVANNMVNGSLNSYSQAIILSGNDVYLAGRQDVSQGSTSYRPLYWKNSQPVLLPYNGLGEALGITVVPRQ